MAVVTVHRDRILVTPRADNRVVKLLPVPDTRIVFALTDDFVKAWRRNAA